MTAAGSSTAAEQAVSCLGLARTIVFLGLAPAEHTKIVKEVKEGGNGGGMQFAFCLLDLHK